MDKNVANAKSTDSSGFLGSFLSKNLKTNQLEVNTDEKTLRPVARLREPRDLFALPKDKDNDCSQQAPRWPIECQVIDERIVHIPYVPGPPEPLYQPTGLELKPRPVGEENGIVVFNYNPISAVNYDADNATKQRNSSDSDISSSESHASTPEQGTPDCEKKQINHTFTSIFKSLEACSLSNSTDDDDDDSDDDEETDPLTAVKATKEKSCTPEQADMRKLAKSVPPVSFNRKQLKRLGGILTKASSWTSIGTGRNTKARLTGGAEVVKGAGPSKREPISSKLSRLKASGDSNENNNADRRNNNNRRKTGTNRTIRTNSTATARSVTNNASTTTSTTTTTNNNTGTNDIDASDSFVVEPQFSRSAVGGSKFLSNCHPCSGDDYTGLEFESRFESGNLAKAIMITDTYYELYLRPDLYTSRSKQWFYFRVSRTKKDLIYRFSIVNLVKSDSLFNEGMRPVMYSFINAKTISEGWRRCGTNICYYRNEDEGSSEEESEDNSSYTLTFNIEFAHDNDTVYFAHSYPYTYSELQDYLMAIQKDPEKSKFCKLRLLCRSLAGNNVYYLTVTAQTADEEAMRRKKSIVVSARVHPSETPASYMMKGLMDFITGDTLVAKRLRHKFIFKLIPMLNPDGVIVGNTRNSLTGKDLNRQYRTVIRETYPSIWYTKAMIKRLIDECGVAMYCDMHAHSRKHNIFVYGCENKRLPDKKLTEQVFPLMMHKNVADKFSFESCKFKVQRSKEGTGRIVVWMLGITNSYTIEASFGGSSLGSRKGTHFSTADYEHMGRVFCETLLDYGDENPTKERLRLKIIERLLKEGSSADEPLNIPLSDYSSDEGSTTSSENEGKNSIDFSDLEGPCCAKLKAPPCSPEVTYQTRRNRKLKIRSKSSSAHRKKTESQRTPLDLPTTDPGSDLHFSTDDEYIPEMYGTMPCHRRILLQSDLQRRYIEEIGDGSYLKCMPPELIVTSPTKQNVSTVISFKLPPKTAPEKGQLGEFPMVGGPPRRTSSWHNLNNNNNNLKSSVVRPRQPGGDYRCSAFGSGTVDTYTGEELNLKLSLKKNIWLGTQPEPLSYADRNRLLSWTMPPIATASAKKEKTPGRLLKMDENHALFNACAQKLMAWQKLEPNSLTLPPTKQKSKLNMNVVVPEINEEQKTARLFKEVVYKKPMQKTALSKQDCTSETKLKKCKNPMPKIAETTQLITRLAKTTKSRSSFSTQRSQKSAVTPTSNAQQHTQPVKFKTGGLVVTAAQPPGRKRKKLRAMATPTKSQQQPAASAMAPRASNSAVAGSKTVALPAAVGSHSFVRKVKSKLRHKTSDSSGDSGGGSGGGEGSGAVGGRGGIGAGGGTGVNLANDLLTALPRRRSHQK